MSLTLIIIFLLPLTTECYFHLHHTDYRQKQYPYYDCLYDYRQIRNDRQFQVNAWSLVPYCIRDAVTTDTVLLPVNQCYGIELTYEELNKNNFTINDLFSWNAPIDTIASFQKYLDSEIVNEKYCSCKGTSYFGSYCEYTFDKLTTFSEIIEKQFEQKTISNLICYIRCDNGHKCLDWREICNGIVDCLNGEDEGEQCIILESNECNLETEFRCKNGICIPKDFAFDQMIDCIDKSDETNEFIQDYFNNRWFICVNRPSIDCEEYYCHEPNLYTCGDGTCRSNYIDNINKPCSNQRDIRELESTFIQNSLFLCEECKLCYKTGDQFFIYLRKQYKLTDKRCKAIESKCKNCTLFEFPSKVVMFPSVRFMYNASNISSIFPEFVCYDENICKEYISTDFFGNFTCGYTNSFGELEFETFGSFFQNLQKIFSMCILPKLEISNKTLYQCESTLRLISIHRIRDGTNDCYNGEDELDIPARIRNKNNYFKCLTFNSNEYIPRTWLFDGINDCTDMSDEMMPFICREQNDLGCQYLRGFIPPYTFYLFNELCNGIVHSQLIFGNDTDETDCYDWRRSCRLKYVSCDRNWNCINGRDEIGSIEVQNCRLREQVHYCRLPEKGNNIVLPIEQFGDGIIDCLGSTDERFDYCPLKYPFELTRRFLCWNSSLCIHIHDTCDGIIDCPYGDDEAACPGRQFSTCRKGKFDCFGAVRQQCLPKSARCNGENDCRVAAENDELFCDLIPQYAKYKPFIFTEHNQYPPPSFQDYLQSITSLDIQNPYLPLFMTPSGIHPTRSVQVNNDYGKYCNRGIGVRSLKVKGNSKVIMCLCPPYYYGDKCEFQNKRVTVLIKIIGKYSENIIFQLLVRLFDETSLVLDSQDIIHVPSKQNTIKNIIYLVYPHNSFGNVSLKYFVRIDVFSVSIENVKYHSTWYFDLKFSFLPVDHLAVQLKLDNLSLNYSHPAHRKNINHNNKTTCNLTSLSFEGQCICPLGTFGNECNVKIDLCRRVKCLNNGTCIPLNIKQIHYACICTEKYYGNQCQYPYSQIEIGIKDLHQDPWFTSISVILVHFVDIQKNSTITVIKDRLLYKNTKFNTNINIIYKNPSLLPTFVYVQTIFDTNNVYGSYYLVSLSKMSVRRVTTNILISNCCPYVDRLLSSEIMSYTYLKRVKYYQRACFTLGTKCFYDENYMCLCDNEGFIDCLVFDHQS
ncbi:unnamed protein product, partial [Rotaria sp. Silwood1]